MNKIYPILHWVLTLIIGPFFVCLFQPYFSKGNFVLDFLSMYPYFLLVGFLLSLPALCLYVFVFVVLSDKAIKPLTLKLMLNGILVAIIIITFMLIDGSIISGYSIGYSVTAIICSLSLRIKKKQAKVMLE